MSLPPLTSAKARSQGLWALWVAAGVGLLLVPLFLFDPSRHGFFPRCLFHEVTGLNCPGCGGLRAAHQILHGHLKEAFALNPLLILLAPVLGWFGAAQVWRATTGRELAHPFKHPAWIWALVIIVVVFGIARNLPIPPFHPGSP